MKKLFEESIYLNYNENLHKTFMCDLYTFINEAYTAWTQEHWRQSWKMHTLIQDSVLTLLTNESSLGQLKGPMLY